MKEKELKEILKVINISSIENILGIYKKVLDFERMISVSNGLSNDKKLKVYEFVIKNYGIRGNIVSEFLKNDEDRVLLIKLLLKENPMEAYYAMTYMNKNNIKKLINKEDIKVILENVSWRWVNEKFGTLFEDEMLEIDSKYKIVEVLNYLSEEGLRKICAKNLDKDGYNRIVLGLRHKAQKKVYAEVFLEEKCTNATVATWILDTKVCDEEEFNKLILIIASYGSAFTIYRTLFAEELNDVQRQILEKALLKTGDIEYISYFYFYKKKSEFIKLFGSTLLFLSFATMNKDKFTDKILLNNIIDAIRKEEAIFSEKINAKVGLSYHKTRKINNENKK